MHNPVYVIGIDLGTTNSVVVYTKVGILELWCVSRADGSRWKLEFNVREKQAFGS